MFAITLKTFILRLPSLSKVGKVHSWLNGRWRHCVCARGKSPRNTSTHLRKLEKAAMVAFMEMPMSAMAKLKTRKLLGVLSSLTLRKAAMVTAFKKKPIRPLKCGGAGGHTHDDNCHSGGGRQTIAHGRKNKKTNKHPNGNCRVWRNAWVSGHGAFSLAAFQALKDSPSTIRHDPREKTSNSEKPSGKGYDETILGADLSTAYHTHKSQNARTPTHTLASSPSDCLRGASALIGGRWLFKGPFHVKSTPSIM